MFSRIIEAATRPRLLGPCLLLSWSAVFPAASFGKHSPAFELRGEGETLGPIKHAAQAAADSSPILSRKIRPSGSNVWSRRQTAMPAPATERTADLE